MWELIGEKPLITLCKPPGFHTPHYILSTFSPLDCNWAYPKGLKAWDSDFNVEEDEFQYGSLCTYTQKHTQRHSCTCKLNVRVQALTFALAHCTGTHTACINSTNKCIFFFSWAPLFIQRNSWKIFLQGTAKCSYFVKRPQWNELMHSVEKQDFLIKWNSTDRFYDSLHIKFCRGDYHTCTHLHTPTHTHTDTRWYKAASILRNGFTSTYIHALSL